MQQIFTDVENLLSCIGIDIPAGTAQSLSNSASTRYKAAAICGGVSAQSQIQAIATGVDVIVSTPGRLLDLCDRGALSLLNIKYFVLDEVDRMLGMGLEEQLRKVVALVTAEGKPCQTLLFSATLPESLERLARSAVVNPIEIQVGRSR